ncbi:hypothetical protein OQA88_3221 [Cercophora sp. LCS_1]
MRQLSISQIISIHPREPLYTHPLVWTARHIDLLSCEFFDDGTIAIVPLVPPIVPEPPQEQPNPNILPTSTTLPTNYPSAPDNALNLDDEWPRCFANLRGDTSAAHSLATCRNSISKQRALSQLLGLVPCRPRAPANPPGARIINKQLRRITPDDPREDPYIAALLIALAQKQRLNFGDDNGGPQVLLATLLGDEWLYIYTSLVSLEFLDGLDKPSRPPPAGAQSRLGMAIHRRRLAFKPHETLPQRLAAAVRDVGLAREHGSTDLDKRQAEAVAGQASGS